MTSGCARRIVIGLGNPDRGDDAVGRNVARMLRSVLPQDVVVAEHDGDGTDLLDRFDGVAAAFFVDACASNASAGAVRRFDVGAAPLPRRAFDVSTHGFGLAEAIELARALGRLPPHCIVYAIEGGSFEAGAPLSPAVAAAAVEVVRRLCAEIDGHRPEDSRRA
jgi:hydrogenase maturation protease